jgi:hypothetical protein
MAFGKVLKDQEVEDSRNVLIKFILVRIRTLSLPSTVRKLEVQNFQLDFFFLLSWLEVSAVTLNIHFFTTRIVVCNSRFIVQLLSTSFRHTSNWSHALTIGVMSFLSCIAVSDSFRYRNPPRPIMQCQGTARDRYLCCKSFTEIFLSSNHI